MYEKIINQIKADKSYNCCRLENKVDAEKIYSQIFLKLNNAKISDCDICSGYSDILTKGVSVYSIELVIDRKTEKPLELNIYSDKSKIWMAITYKNFDINSKIDEKVFSF